MSMTKGKREASLSKPTWYEMTLMDEENIFLHQNPTQVVGGSSGSEGAATTVVDVINPGGGSSRSTFLTKKVRVCSSNK